MKMFGAIACCWTVLCGATTMASQAAPSVIPPHMVVVPGGSFNVEGRFAVETDVFLMDRHPVSLSLWNKVHAWAVTNGYVFDRPGAGRGPNHPVHSVNWYDAVKWCNARSEMEGRTPAYYTCEKKTDIYRKGRLDLQNNWVRWNTGYRLPTEAEWEKAARGGVDGRRFPWSDTDTIQHARANYDSEEEMYAYDTSPSRGYHPKYRGGDKPHTSPVGSFPPNGYGLFDMAGNIWEWCWDWFDLGYFQEHAPLRNPRGPETGRTRSQRGGCWYSDAEQCQAGHRSGSHYRSLDFAHYYDGFRTVLLPGPTGSLRVVLQPEAAVAAGARWSMDGGTTWQDSGATLTDLPVGRYMIVFKRLPNRDEPSLQLVSVPPFAAATVAGAYAPLARYLVVDLSGGPTATRYPFEWLDTVPPGGWTAEHKTTRLVLRRVRAGTYLRGSPENEEGRITNETQHPVTLTGDFFIGVFPVTQRQWERVTGKWPAVFRHPAHRDTRPVESVSFQHVRGRKKGADWPSASHVDADSFLGLLRARTGQPFDLPTETQWECAARAGTRTALNTGHDLTSATRCPRMAEAGRYLHNGGEDAGPDSAADRGTAPVGSYAPNAWGLYDFHGNVFEWCLDLYDESPRANLDPKGPLPNMDEDDERVLRGGAWDSDALCCRSARRHSAEADEAKAFTGFRIALHPIQAPVRQGKESGGISGD